MKCSFLIMASLLLLAALMIEQSGLSWELERPFIPWLAEKTGHQLPGVTAVVLPALEKPTSETQGKQTGKTETSLQLLTPTLSPQDVALAVRALLSFHPDRILVTAPLGDLTNGPLSLLREAQSQGSVQGIPFVFSPLSPQPPSDIWAPFFLSVPPAQVLSLDDLLLRREEMERGNIRPDLEMLFRNRTVFIGGAEAPRQAALLQDAQQKVAVRHLTPWLYGALFVGLILGALLLTRFSEIDFLLLLFFGIVLYSVSIFVVFHFFEILLPIFLPSSFVLIAFLKKHHNYQRNVNREEKLK